MAEGTQNQTPSRKRLFPVVNNRLGNVQISYGRAPGGGFDGARLLQLVTGINLVPEAVWSEAKKQPGVHGMLTHKIVPLGAPEDAEARVGQCELVEGAPLNADNPLLNLSDEDGLRFVANTEALSLLEELAKQSASAPVMQAIIGRIAKLKDTKNQPNIKRA